MEDLVVDNLAMRVSLLPTPALVGLMVGMAVLFALGCNLTHKGRLFYALPIVSALVGYLLLQSVVLSEIGEDVEEWVKQLASSMPIIGMVILVLGAVVFGENNIERHRANRDKTKEVGDNGR